MCKCLKTRKTRLFLLLLPLGGSLLPFWIEAQNISGVQLKEMPDYSWHRGCFGTATGNFFGFWDRHGLPNFYTGPVNNGVAPLLDDPALLIRKFWASEGHDRDYWVTYESTAEDPYVTGKWEEHEPDCIGDFIGLSQKKWSDLNGECAGNIDAYSFVYWDQDGDPRVNYSPTDGATDIQSGLRDWAQYCGYEVEVLTQFTDFNPNCAPGKGFTFRDVQREIHNGYPIMVFLQGFNNYSRPLGSLPNANPLIHGINIFGYVIRDYGPGFVETNVMVRTSWATGIAEIPWDSYSWLGVAPARGVIVVHPKPKITETLLGEDSITLSWDGPDSQLQDLVSGETTDVHRYVVEQSPTMNPNSFTTVAGPTTERQAMIPLNGAPAGFYRIRLLENKL